MKIAANRTRSSSGSSAVLGQLEHPLVEPQPGQLPVEEPVLVLLRPQAERLVVARSYGGSTSKTSSGAPSPGSLDRACPASWSKCGTAG